MDRREALSGMLGIPLLLKEGDEEVIRRKGKEDNIYVGGDSLRYINCAPTNFRLGFETFKIRVFQGIVINSFEISLTYNLTQSVNKTRMLAEEEMNRKVEIICLRFLKSKLKSTVEDEDFDLFCGLNVTNRREETFEDNEGEKYRLSYNIKGLICNRVDYE